MLWQPERAEAHKNNLAPSPAALVPLEHFGWSQSCILHLPRAAAFVGAAENILEALTLCEHERLTRQNSGHIMRDWTEGKETFLDKVFSVCGADNQRSHNLPPEDKVSSACSMQRLLLVQHSIFFLYLFPLDLGDLSCIQLLSSISHHAACYKSNYSGLGGAETPYLEF